MKKYLYRPKSNSKELIDTFMYDPYSIKQYGQIQGLDPTDKILEVSSACQDYLGKGLSALTMTIMSPVGICSVESLYQGSKLFELGGPYTDLYLKKPYVARNDPRLKGSGRVIGYSYFNDYWPESPVIGLYTWLYFNAYRSLDPSLQFQIEQYSYYSDIFYNGNQQVNTPARSLAISIALCELGHWNDPHIPIPKATFLEILHWVKLP